MALSANNPFQRLNSLDVMRGIIMLLLAAESCLLYEHLSVVAEGSFFEGLVRQFFHHPWHGLRFWDLVQPAFMTMAGTAMYFSYQKRLAQGVSWESNFKKVAFRSLKLLAFGVGLHCIYAGKLVWELWNVLSQLAVTTLIAYAIIRLSTTTQLLVSFLLLLVTEIIYRYLLIPGFDQSFVEFHNPGAYIDTLLMGKINSDGWVAINCIPTAAHTIWGVLIGKLLASQRSSSKKISWLIIAGLVALLLGFGLDWLNITPIIKRIATSSFTLASGGWIILMTALLYWMIDLRGWSGINNWFIPIGMNPIFIYVLFETVGHQWINGAVAIFVKGFLNWFHLAESWQDVFASLGTLLFYVALCAWLYRKRIFFKL